jgi:hypothetical protein
MQRTETRGGAELRRVTLAVLLSLTLVASVLSGQAAFAHPEECDDGDEDCEPGDDGGSSEEGEAVYLDGEDVLGRGEDAVFEMSDNMHPLGFSERAVPFSGAGSGRYNSDLAFSGRYAFQGHYGGFRVIDVSDPENPVEVADVDDCIAGTAASGGQGDVVVYGDVLVRSWDAPSPSGGRSCSGFTPPAGQEGVHVFDISDPTAPRAITFVPTPCGSHTATGIPDVANNRLLVYSSPSSSNASCQGVDVLEVPLDALGDASYLRFESSGRARDLVTVDAPSSAAGSYQALPASYGSPLDVDGLGGDLALVHSSTGAPAEGCGPLTDFPAGAIALVRRGTCTFVQKVTNAQDAGAAAVVIVNNVDGQAVALTGTAPAVTIPVLSVSKGDGERILDGLPATGRVSQNPLPAVTARACHDTGVILGGVLKAACAGGNGMMLWSMDPADGGSLTDPAFVYSRSFPGVSIGHSAAFTWDGEVIVFGHEPGGGSGARCQATSSLTDRTLFFLDASTGAPVGTFVQPRPQTNTENCTWHNYNVVPTDKNYVLVSGNYQMGISVIDFSDPSNARQIAYADPHPLSSTSLVLGGDWSTYWHNGFIYQSDIRRGLIVWKLSDPAVGGARRFDHSNPQTQSVSFPRSAAFGKRAR